MASSGRRCISLSRFSDDGVYRKSLSLGRTGACSRGLTEIASKRSNSDTWKRLFLDRLDQHARDRGDRPALSDPRSDQFDAWDTLTWREYQSAVHETTRAFVALGHSPGDAVGIVGPNRPCWVRVDLGAIAAGGMPAGIYATATPEQVEFILGTARLKPGIRRFGRRSRRALTNG